MRVSQLASIIAEIKTALPVGITQTTKDNGLYLKGNPYRDAIKVVQYAGMIGASYENAVNNQLDREDKEQDFFAQEHAWMVRAERNLGRKKNDDGTRYLPFKVQAVQSTKWMLDGVDVTEQVQAYRKPVKASPATQDELDTKVVWRTPSLDSIIYIRMLGAEYSIEA